MMFFPTVIYLELFVALFFLPGFFITVILGIKKFRFLLSFALSYSLLVLTLLPFEYYAQPLARWQWCILLEWVILAVLATVKISADGNLIRNFFGPRLIVPLVLAGVICGYLAYAGPYLEMPSDVWTHVFRFQLRKLNVINSGCFSSGLSFNDLLLNNTFWHWYFNPWYFIHAWLCHVSGLPIMDSLHALTLANVTTFLLGFYFFGLYIFSCLRASSCKKRMMSALAAFLAAVTMGFMVFAYIRYYAFAPTILNYVLFLAAMAVIIDWLISNRRLGHVLWIVPALLIVTSIIHTQEALFIFVMTLALSIAETIRIFWRKIFSLARHSCNQCVLRICHSRFNRESRIRINPDTLDSRFRGNDIRGNHWTVREWKTVILAAVLLIIFFAGFAAIRYFKPEPWISANMIMPHVGIPPEPVNFIFSSLMISPPHNPWLRLAAYQLFIFYQVVGCWGLFVYLLFLLMFRRFIKLPYLTAGLVVVPLLMAFNPVIIDMMARVGQDMALYRFLYLVPLPLAGGYLFVYFWDKAREWLQNMRAAPAESISPIWPRLSWIKFVGCILVLAGLIGLVFPINTAGICAPYSKIYTLRKVPPGNDYRLWDDLGRIVKKHENRMVLTDDLTAMVLSSYAVKNNFIPSKWLNSASPEKDQPEPYTWEKLRNRGLIVINRRNGRPSITGRISGHWPEDVLNVSRYYSIQSQTYLESHPETFRKIWSQNQIAVYAVR